MTKEIMCAFDSKRICNSTCAAFDGEKEFLVSKAKRAFEGGQYEWITDEPPEIGSFCGNGGFRIVGLD